MKSWMKALADHYHRMRSSYPNEKLLIVFDIDGTIVDMRYMILDVLRSYDKFNQTEFFSQLQISDIGCHENNVQSLLRTLAIPSDQEKCIFEWYCEHYWSPSVILKSHRPFRGVLEVIRWFQLQPNTLIGLNTSRQENLRNETLRSLNKLGQEYRVQFHSELLYMNRLGWDQKVPEIKAAGIRHFQKLGYRIFSVVDNEPENLLAIEQMDTEQESEMLLLHADTIFNSKRLHLPTQAKQGKAYDIFEFVSSENDLPKHIQFVLHGVNNEIKLEQFLTSNIHWAEVDVRLPPIGKYPILRDRSHEQSPISGDEPLFLFENFLRRLKQHQRAMKIDLKENGTLLEQVISDIDRVGIEESALWFNADIKLLGAHDFRELAKRYPGAIIQCPVDFLASLIFIMPAKAKDLLDNLTDWGINRFSVSWSVSNKGAMLDQMDEWNFELNIYDVPNLEAFLRSAMLAPKSVTADFSFPRWRNGTRRSAETVQYKKELLHCA